MDLWSSSFIEKQCQDTTWLIESNSLFQTKKCRDQLSMEDMPMSQHLPNRDVINMTPAGSETGLIFKSGLFVSTR